MLMVWHRQRWWKVSFEDSVYILAFLPFSSLSLSLSHTLSIWHCRFCFHFSSDRNDAHTHTFTHSLSHNHLDATTMQLFSMFPYISIVKWHFHSVQCTWLRIHLIVQYFIPTEFEARIIYINLLFVVCQHTDWITLPWISSSFKYILFHMYEFQALNACVCAKLVSWWQ